MEKIINKTQEQINHLFKHTKLLHNRLWTPC